MGLGGLDLARALEVVREVLGRHPVRLAYLFGSAVKDPSSAGDLDLAVLPGPGLSLDRLYADLSLRLDTDRLDLVDLDRAPSWLAAEVVSAGRCLLGSEEERRRFEAVVRGVWREGRRRWMWRLKEDRMPLRKEFVAEALFQLERVADALDRFRGSSAKEMEADIARAWAVEMGLLSGLSLIFQVADHILASHFKRSPGSYEGLLVGLRAEGVISEALYTGLRGAGRFRNMLVHEYMQVDLEGVAEWLGKAPDLFRAFAREVRGWVRGLPEEETEGGP